jgi:hypothetical protein
LVIYGDAVQYQDQGMKRVDTCKNGYFLFNLPTFHFLYYLQKTGVYYIFGYYPSIAKIINCFLGVMDEVNVYLAVNKMKYEIAAIIHILLVLFYPSIEYLHTLNLKEALVVFLLTLIIKKLIYMKENITLKNLFLNLAYCFILVLTRNYVGIFMGLITCIFFLFLVNFYS